LMSVIALQRQLSKWRNHWEAISGDETARLQVAQLQRRSVA
jgi:hypothetical protein